jgi:hypothetical protein
MLLPSKRGPKIFDPSNLIETMLAPMMMRGVAGSPAQEVDDNLHAQHLVLHAAVLVGPVVGHLRVLPL